ncbi:MAG: Vms1/Ankzf1 family peptidyl-tRNA hydrolase, partial [Ilumatobacter sp.]
MDSPDVQTTDRSGVFADLRDLVERSGPFLTAIVPARSDVADASDRLRVETGSALRDAPSEWSDDVRAMESEIADLHHGDGAALIAIRPRGGPTFYEFVADAVHRPSVSVGPLPRLAPLLEARQRTIPHVVVETDLAGADITAFDGGDVVTQQQVEGDTTHIHRGHPGGWSQRRYQQRAENTWDDNAREVSESVRAVVESVGARLTLVTGPTRAQSMLVSLLELQRVAVRAIDAGDPDGMADEIVRRVADVHASDTVAVLDEAKERIEHRADSARH